MFTGIIEEKGKIKYIKNNNLSMEIGVEASFIDDVKLGDSISVNGACLTVKSITNGIFYVDIMHESVNKTNFKNLKLEEIVNLERALLLSKRIDGHLVSGHVDGVGEILSIENDDNAYIYEIKVPNRLLKYMVNKGSICIDGISLTLVNVLDDRFTVSIIPYTYNHTNLTNKKINELVNLEVDMMAKFAERIMTFKEN